MVNAWNMYECVDDPPVLIGAWTGRFLVYAHTDGKRKMICMDVYHPSPLLEEPVWIRSFLRQTPDECIEAFGEWLTVLYESEDDPVD